MEWQNWSFWQTIFSGPQAHGADDGCSALQDIAGGLGLAACRPFASAKPTDMAIARKAIAKVFSIVSSSLDETGRSGPCNLMPAGSPPSSVICYGFILARDGQDAQRPFPLSPGLSRNGPLAAWSARTCRMLRKRPPRVGVRVYDSGVVPGSSLGFPRFDSPDMLVPDTLGIVW